MSATPKRPDDKLDPHMRVLIAADIQSGAKELVEGALPWLDALDARADVVYVDLWAYELLRHSLRDPDGEIPQILEQRTIQLEMLLGHLPAWRRGRAFVDNTSVQEMLATRSGGYDLVLTGTHGRTGLARMWAGSVAEQIVRFSAVSVLVLRPSALPPRPSLLWAIGPDDDNKRLAAAVQMFAQALGGRVDLLTVTELPWIADPPDAPSLYPIVMEGADDLRRSRQAGLEALRDATFPGEPRGIVTSEVGPPVDRIVERATGHDLIVVGTHTRTGLERALLGSVAERVVRRAGISVLVLRDPSAAPRSSA